MKAAIVAKVGLEPTRCEPADFESDATATLEPNGSKTPEITVASFAAFVGGPDRLSESAKVAAARLCRRLRASETGCWEWVGGSVRSGYGALNVDGKTVGAHRLAYEIAFGAIPNGDCVCHRCNRTRCCNPAHLYLATREDNIRDAHRDGLMPAGERHGRRKLSAEQVEEIRAAVPSNGYAQQLAQRFDVHPNTIHRIRRGDNWAA